MRVAVIGAAALDVKAYASDQLANGEVQSGRVALVPGGPALNIATTLARMGAAPMLLSVVGDDVVGEILLAQAGAAGIDVSAVERIPGEISSLQVQVADQALESSYTVWSFDVLAHLTPSYLTRHGATLRSADAYILAFERHAGEAFTWATEEGLICPDVPVGLSLKASEIPYFNMHRIKADWLCLNADEAGLLAGYPVNGVQVAAQAAERIHSETSSLVVLTLGEKGLVIASKGETLHIAIDPVPTRDATGAGDAVQAAFSYCMLTRREPVTAACYGAAAGALAIMSDHSAPPMVSERTLAQYLADHPPNLYSLARAE